MKQGGNLREENSPYDVIRYLPEGTPIEVRNAGERRTTFATNPLGWGAKDHSWSYHTPTANRFKASDPPRHGWIVDENLMESSAPKAEALEKRAETSGSSEVTFEMQVALLQRLAQALVKQPKQLSVQQYQGAATGWLAHSRTALARIVQKVDREGLFAPGIVSKLVAAQTSPEPSPLIHKMIEDVMGDKMFILGDTAADMKVTDWVAKIRDTYNLLVDFPKYFKDERKPPGEQKVMTGRQFFLGEH